MRRPDIAIGLLSAATIFYGTAYAVGRERLRSTDLHQFYQRVNQESFQDSLPDATMKWADLPDDFLFGWPGSFHPKGTKPDEFLKHFSTKFNKLSSRWPKLLEIISRAICHRRDI